jgi:hypothetical protein
MILRPTDKRRRKSHLMGVIGESKSIVQSAKWKHISIQTLKTQGETVAVGQDY